MSELKLAEYKEWRVKNDLAMFLKKVGLKAELHEVDQLKRMKFALWYMREVLSKR